MEHISSSIYLSLLQRVALHTSIGDCKVAEQKLELMAQENRRLEGELKSPVRYSSGCSDIKKTFRRRS